ncbi:MAG: type II secretion system protein [Acidobacteria bacterium]|nr:type II secretion system protein [Acidobacteriota bacterium]
MERFGKWICQRRGLGSHKGITLVELMVCIAILGVMAGAIMPVARLSIKRQKELELRRALRKIRHAIDEYKKFDEAGLILKIGVDSEGYPTELEVLVEGVELVGQLGKKVRFLRRIPVDPMTKTKDWRLRSYQDDPDSRSWGRENVYDIYTTYEGTALDGTEYKDW